MMTPEERKASKMIQMKMSLDYRTEAYNLAFVTLSKLHMVVREHPEEIGPEWLKNLIEEWNIKDDALYQAYSTRRRAWTRQLVKRRRERSKP